MIIPDFSFHYLFPCVSPHFPFPATPASYLEGYTYLPRFSAVFIQSCVERYLHVIHIATDRHTRGHIHKMGIWGSLLVLQKSDHFTHFKNYPLVFSLSSKYPVEIVKGHVCFLSKVLLEHTHAHSLPYCYGYCHSGAEELVSWPKSVQPAKPLLTLA